MDILKRQILILPSPTQTDDIFWFGFKKKVSFSQIKEVWDHDSTQYYFCGENIYKHNINEVELSPDRKQLDENRQGQSKSAITYVSQAYQSLKQKSKNTRRPRIKRKYSYSLSTHRKVLSPTDPVSFSLFLQPTLIQSSQVL